MESYKSGSFRILGERSKQWRIVVNLNPSHQKPTRVLIVICLCLSMLINASCKKDAQSDKGYDVIRFTYGPLAMLLPLFAAVENGYFEKRGIKMEMINSQTAQKAGIKAMEALEIDGSAASFINLTLSRQQGFHSKLIASWGYSGSGYEQTALVVLKNSPIKTINELNGKIVGGFLKATEFGMQQQQLFAKHNVIQCTHIELPMAQCVGALRSGRIDAAQVIEPQLTILKDEIRILALYDEVDARGYAFPDRTLSEKPELLHKWAEALQEGVLFVCHHEERSREILAKWTNTPLPIAKTVRLPIWDLKCRIIEDGAVSSLSWMEQQNLLKKRMTLEELCDFRFTGRIDSHAIAEAWNKEKSGKPHS
jgi:NitT/TauT family transport system substrate-binding protein